MFYGHLSARHSWCWDYATAGGVRIKKVAITSLARPARPASENTGGGVWQILAPFPFRRTASLLLTVGWEAQNSAHHRGFRVGPLPQVIKRALGSRSLLDRLDANGPLLNGRAFAFQRGCLRSLHEANLAHTSASVSNQNLPKDRLLLCADPLLSPRRAARAFAGACPFGSISLFWVVFPNLNPAPNPHAGGGTRLRSGVRLRGEPKKVECPRPAFAACSRLAFRRGCC
jgi:hypothetical protein